MPQRRDHSKNDEIICSVDYQGEVKTVFSQNERLMCESAVHFIL